jgi:hypothetical protein
MSRTRRQAKPVGYEYWSRRPFNKCGGIVGSFTKRRTHKAERRLPLSDEDLLNRREIWMSPEAFDQLLESVMQMDEMLWNERQ